MRDVDAFDVAVFRRIVANDHARRELLWLRAREKGDADSARDLERIDPMLVSRLRQAGHAIDDIDEHPRDRQEHFGRLQDDCYDRHARALCRSRTA